jgi:PIN domain nuclease of toxin-antitoxin system
LPGGIADVAEPDAAVTDTHALVFHAAGGGKLGPRAAAIFARCERREAIIYVPTVVMWECSLLARVSRIHLRPTATILPSHPRRVGEPRRSSPRYRPSGGGKGSPHMLRAFFDDLFSNPAYQPLDLTPDHVLAADDMTFTRDPFDALICASAQTLGMALITRDAQIRASGAVKVIW